ncbi:MAG: flagellin [Lachnospiraceae bacterium]|nr:flagellin [Lachnospiraceae bacterium]
MSGISGVSGSSQMNNYYSALSSGSRINSARDGASESAILAKEDSQVRGYDAGSENLQSGKNMLNIADSALGGVTDYLQRMKELAVRASNGLLTNDDKRGIQSEIDQIKQGITNLTGSTNYNTKNLLDGSNSSMNIVSDGNGTTQSLNNANSTLEALGIKDFNVMGRFDIRDIDRALDKVGGDRTSIGGQTNGLDYALNYNSIASYNTTASKSRTGDTDYADYVSKLQKETTMETYKIMMQKKQQENDTNNMSRLFFSI